jgi:hypothetical protein
MKQTFKSTYIGCGLDQRLEHRGEINREVNGLDAECEVLVGTVRINDSKEWAIGTNAGASSVPTL